MALTEAQQAAVDKYKPKPAPGKQDTQRRWGLSELLVGIVLLGVGFGAGLLVRPSQEVAPPSSPAVAAAAGAASDATAPPSSETEPASAPPSVAAASPGAGPFGFTMGMTLQELGNPQPRAGNPGLYLVKTAPRPHSAFGSYLLRVSPVSGLCSVKGITDPFESDSFGIQVRSKFDDLKERLTGLYGSSTLSDTLIPGSVWKEPRYFMMGLLKKERVLIAVWNTKSGAVLNNNLRDVAIRAMASNTSSAFVFAEYNFSNYDSCAADINRTEDGAL
jgi:hypothetical protein